MVAGLVGGALARLLERQPDLMADEAKTILQTSCSLLLGAASASGGGNLDIFGRLS